MKAPEQEKASALVKEIIDAAGCKFAWRFDCQFPFVHRDKWVFGGWCGICGRWNWQWRQETSFLGATYCCSVCEKQYA